MYKVLIADDETIIREGLISSIKWDKLGLELVGTASNGRDALKKTQKLQPDICLVDIKMPVLNGLDFLAEMNKVAPSAIGIIISGYDTFSFAQQAIRFGVVDYILKPVDEKLLEDSLISVIDKLNNRKKFKKADMEIKKEIDSEDRRKLVLETIRGTAESSFTAEQKKEIIQSFKTKNLILLISKYNFSFKGEHDKRLPESDIMPNVFRFIGQKAGEELIYRELTKYGILLILELNSEEEAKTIKEGIQTEIQREIGYSFEIFEHFYPFIIEDLKNRADCFLKTAVVEMQYSPTIRRIKTYIDKHFTESDLSLARIAAETQMSEGYLSRRFKAEMGYSYTHYIKMKRVELSKKMLCEDDWRICEIAEKVGFSSQHYFCTVFKKTTGYNPSDYQRIIKND